MNPAASGFASAQSQRSQEEYLQAYQKSLAAAPTQPAVVRSPIDERCIALAEQAKDFQSILEVFEQRLAPILVPATPAAGSQNNMPRPEGCHLAEGLHKIRDVNEATLTRLRDILSRLAL